MGPITQNVKIEHLSNVLYLMGSQGLHCENTASYQVQKNYFESQSQ